jgi:hypothetical protein
MRELGEPMSTQLSFRKQTLLRVSDASASTQRLGMTIPGPKGMRTQRPDDSPSLTTTITETLG